MYSLDLNSITVSLGESFGKNKSIKGNDIIRFLSQRLRISSESSLALCHILAQDDVIVNSKNKKDKKIVVDEGQSYHLQVKIVTINSIYNSIFSFLKMDISQFHLYYHFLHMKLLNS